MNGETIPCIKTLQLSGVFLLPCLSRLVLYWGDVIRHYLYFGEEEKEGSREGRTSIVGNYGNEAKKSGMIKIKGPRQEEMDLPEAMYYDKSPGE